MVERRGRARFLLEPRDTIRRRQVGPQYFDGHRPPQSRVLSAVDLAHTARAEQRLERVGTQARAGGQGHDARIMACQSARRSAPAPRLVALAYAFEQLTKRRVP